MDVQIYAPPVLAPSVVQEAIPTAGQSVMILDTSDVLFLNPAGTLATLTVVLPTGGAGRRVTISSAQLITLLTITGTIVGTLTTLALGGFAEFIYSATTSKWYRTG